MIRPTGVRLTSNGSDEHHLSGRVTEVAFRGRGYEHAIDVNGTTRLTGVFADARAKRGRDRKPAHGSGWLSPVPGRA
jgi:iron(III) transport system ATP-binding protein